MPTSTLELVAHAVVTFQERPRPVPADLRPIWRIALISLFFGYCRGGTATAQQLHALDWASRNVDAARELTAFLSNNQPVSVPIARLDPAVNRAIHFATGSGIVEMQSPLRMRLTGPGTRFAQAVMTQQSVLASEKRFLAALPRKLAYSDVERLFAGRTAN